MTNPLRKQIDREQRATVISNLIDKGLIRKPRRRTAPSFKPYVRSTMSNQAGTVVRARAWLAYMKRDGFSADHPDFNPDFPRSVASKLRAAAAAIIAGTYEVNA